MNIGKLLWLLVFLSLVSCDKSPRTLKVALYPFIPTGSQEKNFDTLKSYIVEEFEKVAPDVELELYLDPKLDPYSPSWELKDGKLPGDSLLAKKGVHVLEIDGLILGELAEFGFIHNLDYKKQDFLDQANEVVTYKGKSYGVPTWICGLFRFAPNESRSSQYVGSLESEWRMLLLYLEAQLELGMDEFILSHVDKKTESIVKKKLSECAGGKAENCFVSEKKALSNYIKEEGNSYIGYGETYEKIKRKMKNPDKIKAKSLEFVDGNDQHLLLSDALVVNKSNCHEECLKDAKTFIRFFTSNKIQKAISLNKDNKNNLPRYLSSARKDFLTKELVDKYPIYDNFYKHFLASKPAPNYGVIRFLDTLKKSRESWSKIPKFSDESEKRK